MTSSVDLRALADFRYRLRLFLSFSEREARTAGLEPQQHQLLLALEGLPAGLRPTIRVLAERLQLRHHSVVGLVDRLAKGKLVLRRRSESDGREVHVEVTLTGKHLLRRLSRAHQLELRSAGPALHLALNALLGSPARAAARRRMI